VKLPDEHRLDIFIAYLNYTYREKLPTEDIKKKVSKLFPEDPYTILAQIYVLGERMLDKSVRNAVVREMLRLPTIGEKDVMLIFPGCWPIDILYEGTSKESPIRRLLIDQRVVVGELSWGYSENTEFLTDLSKALLRNILNQKTVRDFRSRVLLAEDYFV
jgi:hypothetical protein